MEILGRENRQSGRHRCFVPHGDSREYHHNPQQKGGDVVALCSQHLRNPLVCCKYVMQVPQFAEPVNHAVEGSNLLTSGVPNFARAAPRQVGHVFSVLQSGGYLLSSVCPKRKSKEDHGASVTRLGRTSPCQGECWGFGSVRSLPLFFGTTPCEVWVYALRFTDSAVCVHR